MLYLLDDVHLTSGRPAERRQVVVQRGVQLAPEYHLRLFQELPPLNLGQFRERVRLREHGHELLGVGHP